MSEHRVRISGGIDSGIFWAGMLVAIAILLLGSGWQKRADCAIGIDAACAEIAASYAPSTPTVGDKTP